MNFLEFNGDDYVIATHFLWQNYPALSRSDEFIELKVFLQGAATIVVKSTLHRKCVEDEDLLRLKLRIMLMRAKGKAWSKGFDYRSMKFQATAKYPGIIPEEIA